MEKNEPKKNNERWHYFITGVLTGIIVMLVYGEFSKSSSTTAVPSAAQQNAVQGMPIQNSAAAMQELSALQKAADADPKNAAARLSYANALHDARTLQQAIEQYRKYLALNPANPDARVDMGICYFDSGDPETALKEMKQALVSVPNHQMALFNIGVVLMSTGKIKEAQTWFKKTIETNPTTETAKRAQQVLTQHAQLQ
ncbi:MAG: tetratricopeptide repeat protein [Ignavibacteriales bacterium]|nr:tetratricopeptide repeat protein [Ignavibacteriales bacterium]